MCFPYNFYRAYETLGNASKRQVYDATGLSSNEQQNSDINFDGFSSMGNMFWHAFSSQDAQEEQMGNKSYEEILEEYEKFFTLDEDQIQGQNRDQARKKRRTDGQVKGSNIVKPLSISFTQSIAGMTKGVPYSRKIVCKSCDGSKVKSLKEQMECVMCFGTGEDSKSIGDVCPACHGSGLQSVNCETCHGEGLVNEQVNLQVKIPSGVDEGMLLRVRDRGNQAINGQFGDFIICVGVKPHAKYRREGYDIHCDQ